MPPRWVAWLVAAAVVVAGVTIALLIVLPALTVPNAPTAEQRNGLVAQAGIRATILQTVAGLVILVSLGFTARSVHLSRETHLTDRLSSAVDQLGHDKPEVRIGGIYALRRLAENSPVDQHVICNILNGYLTSQAGPGAIPPPHGTVSPDVQIAARVLVELRA
jgi:hypothetical protein